MSVSITLCIPTLNPGVLSSRMVEALKGQSQVFNEILVIDSSSSDGSTAKFTEIGAKIVVIDRADFDHGGTRNLAFHISSSDIYVFLTQDAIPVDRDALKRLVDALIDEPSCGMVYGRQAPNPDAGFFARHARLYNYPDGHVVTIKSVNDIPRLGIKAAFCSNSFSAYRRSAMEKIGFFSENTLFAEDSIAAANFLKLGWSIGYVADAVVNHSHDYSLKQDFCRYFDVGAFHSMNRWYIEFLGKAEGEGLRFVRSEYAYLKQEDACCAAFQVVLRNAIRWLGYRTGRAHSNLPISLKLKLSTNRAFWERNNSIQNSEEG